MDKRAIIRAFIEKELSLRGGLPSRGFTDQESLLLSKLTDSLFFVDLMVFLEKQFSLSIAASELGKEDLDSVDKMVKFVEAREQ